ncbi:hypothetical protein DNH61_11780 [Paenibacillus sambharensis]|uniref:Uncharacterized protein n=1 Tax=Paenibacillus sambharensis TaxID=1803190 RepID=A0A2W1L8J9_9BACL|nr:hypothetical protein [Paenibacillus sambharensis]PZD95233.1 hypothetical protein DNH61_11780 [Paenibacillus sambharensis]
MAKTLSDLRYTMERYVQDSLDNQNVINWCNDAQTEIMLSIEIPDAMTLEVNNTDISYPILTDNIKRISRMWLASDRQQGVDRDLQATYRLYGGHIVFSHRFAQQDVLHIEFYRHLKHFAAMTDTIDLSDRYESLYTSYGIAQYYDLPSSIQRMGEQTAKRLYDKHYTRHMMIKEQISVQYLMESQPYTIKGGW